MRARLINRHTEQMDVIETRIETARKELEEKDIYDYVLINENGKSEETMEKVYKILHE